MNGDHRELLYLERKIKELSDCHVLNSKKNDGELSKKGILVCADELAREIEEEVRNNPNLRRISMVGMSLGGLISRAAARKLFNFSRSTIAGLQPEIFMGIASPFIGMRGHTFLPIPRYLEKSIGWIIGDTGKELFASGEGKSLVFDMCTTEEYLAPLRTFRYRRLYAAIQNDFMVPVTTAAFLEEHETDQLRTACKDLRGLVTVLDGQFNAAENDAVSITSSWLGIPEDKGSKNREMRDALNALGWEKVLVNFGGMLPLAHLQICANERWPGWVTSPMGIELGHEIMDDSANYLCSGNFVDSRTCQLSLSTSSLNKPEDGSMGIASSVALESLEDL